MKIFKSLLYSVLIFVLIGSLGACSEECGYDSHAGYQLGKQNFDYLEDNVASIFVVLGSCFENEHLFDGLG